MDTDDTFRSLRDRVAPFTQPSNGLLTAALSGLLALSAATGCGDDPEPGAAPVQSGGAGGSGAGGNGATGGTYNNVISEGKEISAAELQAMCDERNGWLYVTSTCSGSGMCKGLSLLGDTLTDHSCKGMNACGGAGCVVLPKDGGLSGEEIFTKGPCSGCHGDWSDHDNPNLSYYTILHGPELTDEEALTRFEGSSDLRLQSIVVFGVQGFHASGTPYSNMPGYYQKYSRAEIERVVEYLKGLPGKAAEYEIYGVTPGFGVPE